MTREENLEYMRQYYRDNAERLAAQSRARRIANAEQHGAEQRKIRDARKALGYTQVDVAKLTGISQPMISLIERGQMKLSVLKKRDALLNLLGLKYEGGVLK